MEISGRKDRTFVVKLLYAPTPWLLQGQPVEVSVRCVVSVDSYGVRLDLATLLGPLPPELVATLPKGHKGSHAHRRALRAALESAMEAHLGRKVIAVHYDRIDWGEDT